MNYILKNSLIILFSICFLKVNAQKSPNIIVFLADDVGWKDAGCYGNSLIKTPTIDQLAKTGLKVEKAFVASPQCSPSRISLLTGKYPHTTHTEDLHTPIPAGMKILPTFLKEKGYFTGSMQKIHTGIEGEKQFDWYSENVEDFSAFLNKTTKQPFLMWVGFHDAHRPYAEKNIHPINKVFVPKELVDSPQTRKDIALYYDEIERMDRQMGEMLAELDKKGLRENTLIIYMSDNGQPFARAKGTCYDAGMREPLIFNWKNKIVPNQVFNNLVSFVDIFPTLLEVAGVNIPSDIEGKSLKNILDGKPYTPRKYVASERNWHNCDEHIRSIRTQKFKFIRNAYIEWPFGIPADMSLCLSTLELKKQKARGKLSKEQSLIFQIPRPELELYDLGKDPDEYKNVAYLPKYAKIVKEMTALLDNWVSETQDHSPLIRRRYDNVDRYSGIKFTDEQPPMFNEKAVTKKKPE